MQCTFNWLFPYPIMNNEKTDKMQVKKPGTII